MTEAENYLRAVEFRYPEWIPFSVHTFAQQYFPFLTPREIFDYFEEVVVKLGAEEGGLMGYVEIDPDVPLENVEAIFQAVEDYRCYYS